MRNGFRSVVVVGAIVLVGGSAACSGAPPARNGPYAAEFEQARENAVSDFQREVLNDDVITDEEYRETRQRYLDCNAEAGMHVEFAERGTGYEFSPAPTAEQAAEELRCSAETISVIQSLYEVIGSNPENLPFSPLIVECLQQQGVVDEAFTADDWDRFDKAFTAVAAVPVPAKGVVTPAPIAPSDLPTLPGGVPMDDPRVQQCSENPLGL